MSSSKSTEKKLILGSFCAGVSLLLFGCGGYSTRQAITEGHATFVSGDSDPLPSPTPTVFPSGSPTPTPTATQAVYSFRVGATGYKSTTVTVSARKVLKLRFAPGVQDETVANTNFQPNYSMLGVYIAVGSSNRATPPLYNGFNGTPAEQSDIMDYSSSIPSSTCTRGSDTGCRDTITITVSQPNYDYWCINYGMYCPWTHAYDTHPWHGTLTIQTDDTVGL